MKLTLALLAVLCIGLVSAETYFKETFDKNWEKRWVVSNWKKSSGEAGSFKLTAGKYYGDAEADKGIQTSQDARFYGVSAKMNKVFDNKDKDLVLQFSVKHEQKIDCGGGYIKLLPPGTDQETFSGDSKYNIMFGPDICGTSTKKVHVILNYNDKNHLIKKEIPCETDQLTHVYTLIIRPDQTYEVRIDGTKKDSGSLLDDWDFLPAKTIKDPSVSKPKDWVDEPMMDDPEDTKPKDWDSTPKQIPDPEAQKPQDWDDEADGAWEPPMIDNPEYKGDWKPKKIPNPAYKGKWSHPEIPNPDFKEDKQIYAFKSEYVGFDLWQVKSGSIFDNIIVTDDIEEAEQLLADTYGKNKDAEKKAFDQIEKAEKDKQEEERKKKEDEEKKKKDAEKEDEDEEEDDDEEEKKPKDKDEL